MAQKKIVNLQYPMVWSNVITFADLGDQIVIDVPPGFILIDANIMVRTAFNGTTPQVGVVDNKAAPTSIIAAAPATAGAKTMVTASRFAHYPSGGKIIATFTVASGTPTAGEAHFIVEGIADNRQNERVGTYAAT